MLNKEEKEYFYSKFETVEYQLDTYTLFMEKAHKILKTNSNSIISFILAFAKRTNPDIWAINLKKTPVN